MPESGLGLPDYLSKSHEVYVIVTAGAGYTRVEMLSISMSPDGVAEMLAKALSNAGLNARPPVRGSIVSHSVARALICRPRYGAREISNRVPIGRIVRGFRAEGLTPHVLLRVPNYARADDVGLRTHRWPRNTWYNATSVPSSFIVTVKASIPTGLILLLWWIRLILPGIGAVGFAVGLAVGLNRRLPAPKRMAWFDWSALMVPMGCGMVGAATIAACENSACGHLIRDAWYGNPDYRLATVAYIVWAGVCILAVPLAGLALRHRIFREVDNEPDVADLDRLVSRVRRRGWWAASLMGGYAVYLLAARPFEFGSWGTLLAHGGMLTSVVLCPVFLRFAACGLLAPNTVDHELTERAKKLAAVLGVRVNEVRVATSSYAKKNANGCALPRKKRIIVTQMAAEASTPAELDWLLAHELAHFRERGIYWRAAGAWSVALIVTALLAEAMVLLSAYARSQVAVWSVGLLPVLFLACLSDIGDIRRRLEYEADIQGLGVVGDLNVAISALKGMAANSQNPKTHDQELDEHPKLIKRIRAVRAEAARLGIPESAESAAADVHTSP